MLQEGDRIPDVEVWLQPGVDVKLPAYVAEGPVLLLFYLLDWTST